MDPSLRRMRAFDRRVVVLISSSTLVVHRTTISVETIFPSPENGQTRVVERVSNFAPKIQMKFLRYYTYSHVQCLKKGEQQETTTTKYTNKTRGRSSRVIKTNP